MSSHSYPSTSSVGSPYWGDPVATSGSLPVSGTTGEVRLVLDTDDFYEWTGAAWVKITENTADVQGPASSADNAIARFDGMTGKLIQQASGATISDANVITASGFVGPVTGNVTGNVSGNVTGNLTGDVTGNVDSVTTGGTDTLNLGTANADVVNIGRSGATINLQGTTAYQNVTNYEVSDKNITINKGGSAASGTSAGLEVEEDSVVTGYAKTSGDRNSWVIKAPNTAGVATVTPGAGGITVDQSSHNPVTLGTANGLSLSTQQLSLQAASGSQPGALSAADWTTFNNKQAAVTGGATTILSSDLTASRALVSDTNGKVAVAAATTLTEIGYVNGVTSAIQTQIDARLCPTSVAAVSSDLTLTNKRIHLVDTSAARSLTLPSPTSGAFIVVKDKTGSASSNNITIVRAASEKIETVAASYVLDTDLGSWTIVSDGTDWFII